jgi:hypothetical protein
MTVGAHHGADMKNHYIKNDDLHDQHLSWWEPFRWHLNDRWRHLGSRQSAATPQRSTVAPRWLVIDGCTLTVSGDTLMDVPWWSITHATPSRHNLEVTSATWLGGGVTSMTQRRHHATTNTDSAPPSSAWLGRVITRPSNTFPFASTKRRSDLARRTVAELDSIRIMAYRVQIRDENLYILLTLLFSLYPILICRSDQMSCYHGR